MRRRRAGLWGSCRLNLALMCLAATLAFFLMRLNLSFALVCMVRETRNETVVMPRNFSDEIIAPLTGAKKDTLLDDVDDLQQVATYQQV